MISDRSLARLVVFAKTVRQILDAPEIKFLSGHLALFAVLSLFPAFILVSFAAARFDLPVTETVTSLWGFLPAEVIDILVKTALQGARLPVGAWLATAFVTASNGVNAVLIGVDSIYAFEPLRFWTRRLKALLLTLIMVVFVILGLIALASLNLFLAPHHVAWRFGKWLALGLLLFLFLEFVYISTPRKKIPGRHTVAGAMLTAIAWMLTMRVYVLFMMYFGNYGNIYGELVHVFVLITWIYLLSYTFTLGLAVNAYIYKAGGVQEQASHK